MASSTPTSPPSTPARGNATLLWLVAALGVLSAVFIVTALRDRRGADGIGWYESLPQAAAAAARDGKPMFVDFTQDGCMPCEVMHREVFPEKPVAEMLSRDFVPVRVNMARMDRAAEKLSDRLMVYATPTLVVLDPQGNPVARHEGGLATQSLVRWLQLAHARATTQPAAP